MGDADLSRPAAGRMSVNDTALRDRDHAVAQRVVLIPQDTRVPGNRSASELLLAPGLSPDPDVLDIWFASALRPFRRWRLVDVSLGPTATRGCGPGRRSTSR